LPKGVRWFDFKSGALAAGSRITITSGVATEGLPKDALPMFAREGAIIAQADHLVDVFPPAPTTTTTRVIYEDDGKANPTFSRTTLSLSKTDKGLKLEATREGTLAASPLTIRFRRIDHAPTQVSLPFTRDAGDRSITVTGATPPFAITIDADLNLEPDGDVNVPLRIVLPAGTPTTTPIHIATSRNGWTHVPITRNGDEASAAIAMPRGAFTFFKITRGGWPTVEKGEGCIEIGNRSVRGAASGTTIEIPRWADTCP
jgi:alpha-glucosidase